MSRVMEFNVNALLGMRRHISIVHHLPGRIRLRLGPAMWGRATHVDRGRFQALVAHLEGIRDVRVNMAVASVVIEFDPRQVHPDNWETLVRGDTEAAGDLLNQWLACNGLLLRNTFVDKE